MAPDVAERVREVRRAYARALATSRSEFPTQSEFELAHRLWREGCRDAAVAIMHYNGLNDDDRFWKSEQLFNEALDEFDADDKEHRVQRLPLSSAERRLINAKIAMGGIKGLVAKGRHTVLRVSEARVARPPPHPPRGEP